MKPKTALAAILLGVAATKACAQSIGIAAQSAYEMRGIGISDKPVIQPEASFSYKACAANSSAAYETGKQSFTGVGAAAQCAVKTRYATITPNAALNTFLPDGTTTVEVGATIALEQKLKPTLVIARDLRFSNGTYVEAGISGERKVGRIPLAFTAATAYNDGYYRHESGMSHAEIGLAVPLQYGKLSFIPQVHAGMPFGAKPELITGLKAVYTR